MHNKITAMLEDSIRVQQTILSGQVHTIERIVEEVVKTLRRDNKIVLCGNGGSAADAMHIAGELVGRYKRERTALPAIALTTNTSIVTAIANDYGFDAVFSRQVQALVRAGDIVFALSTSGMSRNVIAAIESANKIGACTIGLTGSDGGELASIVTICIIVQSNDVPRIQEAHMIIGHIVCELVERELAEAEEPQIP